MPIPRAWSAPPGSPSIWPTPTSGSSTPAITCPMQNRSARAEYDKQHIPGAVFFDVDEIADSESPLPHMLPSPEKFASRVRKLGLGDGNRIVVYDSQGLFSAARVWWSFRVFGHKDVAVLDGGLPKWLAEGRPVDDIPPQPRERHFTARFDHSQVREQGPDAGQYREQAWPGAGRPIRRPLPRPRAGSLAGPAQRPYPRLAQPALHRSAESRRQDACCRPSSSWPSSAAPGSISPSRWW